MSESIATSAPAPETAPAASSNWRDASSWRRGDAPAPASSSSSSRPQRLAPTRTGGASSWRDREERKGADDGQTRGGNYGSRRLEASDFAPRSRPFDRVRTNRTPQKDDDGAAKAIAEGRRIYLGNLRYQAKPEDIEDLLRANDLGHFTNIHISIDPFTGRNPSYCFAEFPDAESAVTAMQILEGKELLGREGKQDLRFICLGKRQLDQCLCATTATAMVIIRLRCALSCPASRTFLVIDSNHIYVVKCRPCQPKGSGTGGKPSEAPNRWGQWSNEKDGDDQSKPKSFDRYRQDFTGRRLYVGGLPRMHDQATNFAEMTELFKDFKV